MIFEFKLKPIEEIHPWGESPNQSLSWFGFTDGEYRLKVGSEYLLNYSEEFTNYLNQKFPEYISDTTFVEYQIVRLWEDILDTLPAILEPVPKEIQHFLDSGYESFIVLENRAAKWQESEVEKGVNKDETWNIIDLTAFWINNRWLDSAYLSPNARIWIWSDEKDVIFSWDNREVMVENIPVWSATQGNYRISKKDFINEVQKFDKSLISQMNERVKTICRIWNKPEIKIDFEYLIQEQKVRATWIDSRFKNNHKTDWIEVIWAIKKIKP